MKINKLLITSALSLCLFTNCNNSGKSTSGESLGGLFSNKGDKEEANAIIAFNNEIVKVNNSQTSAINTFTRNFDGFDKFVKDKVINPDAVTFPPVMIFPPVVQNFNFLKYPDGLEKEMKPLIDQMTQSFDAIKDINKEIGIYKSAEDWKEDKGKKMDELREKATSEIKRNREASAKIFANLKPIVDKAEEVTLDGNPLKSQYIRSKKLLDIVQETTNLAFESTDQAKLKEDLKKKYQEIEKLYNENKADGLPKEYSNKVKMFENYNDSINGFLAKMRIAQRELDAGTELSEGSLTNLDNAAQSALTSYNGFVG